MPADDYSSAVGGGLKLKGSKPTGIGKRKKKDKSKIAEANATEGSREGGEDALIQKSGIVGEDIDEKELAKLEQEAYAPGDGKTEAERKHEEMKRKRVGTLSRLGNTSS